ncbi:helix-turn-helix domain-containing protein [Streptomyces sp. NBS 14/10]|uniref:helix-turn-helix domain-containing protein n=1 Tax=Streptomyces sp. NBS 14/10 TaxID=1945643 RepID=UPI001C533405
MKKTLGPLTSGQARPLLCADHTRSTLPASSADGSPRPQQSSAASQGVGSPRPRRADNDLPTPPVEPTAQGAQPATHRLLHTPEQAAALLQVPASWLRKKAAARSIPCTRVGRHLRFSTEDLNTIIRSGSRHPDHT